MKVWLLQGRPRDSGPREEYIGAVANRKGVVPREQGKQQGAVLRREGIQQGTVGWQQCRRLQQGAFPRQVLTLLSWWWRMQEESDVCLVWKRDEIGRSRRHCKAKILEVTFWCTKILRRKAMYFFQLQSLQEIIIFPTGFILKGNIALKVCWLNQPQPINWTGHFLLSTVKRSF